jgi:hypothetical protein
MLALVGRFPNSQFQDMFSLRSVSKYCDAFAAELMRQPVDLSDLIRSRVLWQVQGFGNRVVYMLLESSLNAQMSLRRDIQRGDEKIPKVRRRAGCLSKSSASYDGI